MKKREKSKLIKKAESRRNINIKLMVAAISIFVFILSLKESLLIEYKIITLQIVLSIPFLLTSVFLRDKQISSKNPEKGEFYAWITFIIGYSFLINMIGILTSVYIGIFLGMCFFVVNIILSFLYSFSNEKQKKFQMVKWFFFFFLQMLLGILPSLKIY